MSTARVLLADTATQWHEALLGALGGDADSVKIISDGQKLREELEKGTWRVVIVGDGLTGMSGLDAIYHASKTRKEKTSSQRSILLLIFDARLDTELLTLLRSRGIDGFIPRDAVEEGANRIRSCLYVNERVAPRESIKEKASVEINGKSIHGTLEDLSAGGAMLVLPAKKLVPPPAMGSTLSFQSTILEVDLQLNCVLRRLDVRKGLLGDRCALGVSFHEPTFDQTLAIETALDRVRRMRDPNLVDGDSLTKWM